MEKTLATIEEMRAEAAQFMRGLRPRMKGEGATLITLSGDLGAGKTAFTQALAAALGVAETVTSPTFVIEKIYQLPPDAAARAGVPEHGAFFTRLIHIDAYRLESSAELMPLGFGEIMQSDQNLVVLEWPEKVADALPPPAHYLSFEALADGSRKIMYA